MCGFNAIFYIVGSFYCVLQINIMSHLQTIRVVHNCILGVVPQLESNLATNGVPRCASLSLSLSLSLSRKTKRSNPVALSQMYALAYIWEFYCIAEHCTHSRVSPIGLQSLQDHNTNNTKYVKNHNSFINHLNEHFYETIKFTFHHNDGDDVRLAYYELPTKRRGS